MSSQFFTLYIRQECETVTQELADRCLKRLTEEANRISQANKKLYIQGIAPHSLIVQAGKKYVLAMSLIISFSGEIYDPIRYEPDDERTHFYTLNLEATPQTGTIDNSLPGQE